MTPGAHDDRTDGCAQCGLPAPATARFCCYGCELAHGIQSEARDDHASLYGVAAFTLVLSMIVMMLALFLYAEDVFDASSDLEMAWLRSGYRWASWVLTTPVMALAGFPLARRAAAQLAAGRLSMDALITLGAFAAYVLSVDALLVGRRGLYFDSAATALVLATFGRWLEATARSKASRALGPLVEVSRGMVKCRDEGGTVITLAAAEIEPGMRIEVAAGEVVPADLRLERDSAEVSLAVLTGESRPVTLRRGDVVPAGASPIGADIAGVALRASRDSALERLATLARSLGERRSGVLAWADRFASAVTPLVALVAVGTLVFWTRHGALERGVIAGLAVVLAACPCSYAIASPLVHWLTLRRAFSRGVLIRGADVVEALAQVRTVAFDKTGTLTRPDLRVSHERLAPGLGRAEVLGVVRALEEDSSHPAARALIRHAGGAETARIEDRRVIAGRGVHGVDERGREVSLRAGADGATVLERDGAIIAAFELDEELRPEAREAVDALRAAGVRALVLSGDAESRVRRMGDALGIEAHGGLAPEEKVRRVEALGDSAAMVGDGINDAPALARRTSFTPGDAAQLAKGIAQVTLLDADLRLVPWTIALSRRAIHLVKSLLFFSTAYNVVFVGLAAAGALRPVWAGVSMLLSSLFAVAVATKIGGETDGGRREPRALAAEAVSW